MYSEYCIPDWHISEIRDFSDNNSYSDEFYFSDEIEEYYNPSGY